MSSKEPCALCGQPVEITGFKLETKEGTKHFCCAGCQSIYHLLNEDNITNNNKQEENNQ